MCISWRKALSFFPGWSVVICLLVRPVQNPAHLFAHGEARTVQPNPDRPRLKIENLCHLFGGQLFHIVEDKNNPQLSRDAQDRLMQKMVLLCMKQVAFRTLACIL